MVRRALRERVSWFLWCWIISQPALLATQAAFHVAQVVLELSHRGLQLVAQLLEGVLPLREQLDQLLPTGLSGDFDPRDRTGLPAPQTCGSVVRHME